MVVAVATLSNASQQLPVLGFSSAEFQSPLYLALPVQNVNDILGLLRDFVKEVAKNPERNHELELPMSLVEDARAEIKAYTDKATKKLERLKEELQSVLNDNSSFGEVEVISHVKEPKSWVEKVVGRLLLREGDEKSPYLKDMFRIGVIVKDDSKLEVVHDAVRDFLRDWQDSADLKDTNGGLLKIDCVNFISEPKRNLGEHPENPASPWRGIKGYVVTVGGFVFEYQIKSEDFVKRENDTESRESHSLYEKKRTEIIAERAERLGLHPAFVPFSQQLLRQILVDPEIHITPPPGIAIARTSDQP
jgi:hypothetical protein